MRYGLDRWSIIEEWPAALALAEQWRYLHLATCTARAFAVLNVSYVARCAAIHDPFPLFAVLSLNAWP
jgi:hypothetical protein